MQSAAGQRFADARARANFDLGISGEIHARALGDVRLDLIGDHPACGPDQTGEDGGVIACSGPDLDDRLALFRRERVD